MSTDTDPAPRTSPHAGTVDLPAGSGRDDPSVSVAIPYVALPVSLDIMGTAGATRCRRSPHGRRTARWFHDPGRRTVPELHGGRRRGPCIASTRPQLLSRSATVTCTLCPSSAAIGGSRTTSSTGIFSARGGSGAVDPASKGQRRVRLETPHAHPPSIREFGMTPAVDLAAARVIEVMVDGIAHASGLFKTMIHVTCCVVDHCHVNQRVVGNDTQSAQFLSLC